MNIVIQFAFPITYLRQKTKVKWINFTDVWNITIINKFRCSWPLYKLEIFFPQSWRRRRQPRVFDDPQRLSGVPNIPFASRSTSAAAGVPHRWGRATYNSRQWNSQGIQNTTQRGPKGEQTPKRIRRNIGSWSKRRVQRPINRNKLVLRTLSAAAKTPGLL